MRVTFCGHGDGLYDEETKTAVKKVIEMLIQRGADEFLMGGYGDFDKIAALAVNDIKKKYPYIKNTIVLPYPDRKYDCLDFYDESVYPPLENVPKRLAIIKRNEWMIDNSDVLIAYVEHMWGGAAQTYTYAKRKNKHIINLADGSSLGVEITE